MVDVIERGEGRRLFGHDPDAYDDVRPRYPESLYEFLVDRGALGPHTSTLEIGAGSGVATRSLLRCGADPLTIVEPDERFLPRLKALAAASSARCELVCRPFEELEDQRRYRLVTCATAFHWVEPSMGLAKVARLLEPGGHAALWWNVLADLARPDLFHDATQTILRDLAVSPSGAPDTVPFALDRNARETDFADAGHFDAVQYFEAHSTLVLDTRQVGKLYEGFSHIQRLPVARRNALLKALMDVAAVQFGGRVERNVTTVMYLARRK